MIYYYFYLKEITYQLHIMYFVFKEVMREAGYLIQLQQLIYHPEESVQITALVALGNLALNKNNSKEMKVRTSN